MIIRFLAWLFAYPFSVKGDLLTSGFTDIGCLLTLKFFCAVPTGKFPVLADGFDLFEGFFVDPLCESKFLQEKLLDLLGFFTLVKLPSDFIRLSRKPRGQSTISDCREGVYFLSVTDSIAVFIPAFKLIPRLSYGRESVCCTRNRYGDCSAFHILGYCTNFRRG